MAKFLYPGVAILIALLLVTVLEVSGQGPPPSGGGSGGQGRPPSGGGGGSGGQGPPPRGGRGGPPPRDEIFCQDLVWIGEDTFQIFTESFQKERWGDAKAFCETVHQDRFSLDGNLAVLSNSTIASAVRDHLKDSDRFSHSSVKGFWVGCDKMADGSGFAWIGGASADGDSLWLDGQPDNAVCNSSDTSEEQTTADTMTTEGCCRLWNDNQNDDDQFMMDDACCAQKMQFICQFPGGRDQIGPDTCVDDPRGPRCPSDLTDDDKGIIQWPSSRSGQFVQRKCPFSQGNAKQATRECLSTAGGRVEWGEADTSECTPQSQVSRGNRLNHLANTTIPRGQAKKVSRQLNELTAGAENFEESDMENSVDIAGNIVDSSGENGTEVEVAKDVLRSVDNLAKVGRGVLKASQKNENAASRLIKVIEKLSLTVALEEGDMGNDTVTIETPNVAMTVAKIDREVFSGFKFKSSAGKTKLSTESESESDDEEDGSSIELPMSLLDDLDAEMLEKVDRVQFLAYKDTAFFEAIDETSAVGLSGVISASIGDIRITGLRDKVKLRLEHQEQDGDERPPNVGCVFWDFELKDGEGGWSSEGCVQLVAEATNNVTVCECNHLTNFAVIDDINKINSANQNMASLTVYLAFGMSLLAWSLMSG